MNEKINIIIEELKKLTLIEASELISKIESTFNIDTNINLAPSVQNVSNTSLIETKEEKTNFNIFLEEVPSDKKIAILKVIRNVTGLGLKESKDIVDNIPKLIKENISKEESELIKKELENAGGKVKIT